MPGTLILDSAAELAATAAHLSVLTENNDAGFPVFRMLTPHLADIERRRHWGTLLDAAAHQFEFDNAHTRERAAIDAIDRALDHAASAGDSTGVLCGLDAELYRSVEPADRPGENDNDGYDIGALARDLTSAWEAELVNRARIAVDPNAPTEQATEKPGHTEFTPVGKAAV
jgi:hypothetical protein